MFMASFFLLPFSPPPHGYKKTGGEEKIITIIYSWLYFDLTPGPSPKGEG
jgi:hypothetical protein